MAKKTILFLLSLLLISSSSISKEEAEWGLIGEIKEIIQDDIPIAPLGRSFINYRELEKEMYSQSEVTGLTALAIVNTGPMQAPTWNFKKDQTVAPRVYMYLYSAKSKVVLNPWICFFVLNYGEPLKNIIVEMTLDGPRTSTKKKRVSLKAEKGYIFKVRAKLSTKEIGLYTMTGILIDGSTGSEVDRVSSKFYIFELIGYQFYGLLFPF